jgi:isocitrate dehydrogenase
VSWWDWPHERLDALLSTGLLGNSDIEAFLEAAEAIYAGTNAATADEETSRIASVLEEGCMLTELEM